MGQKGLAAHDTRSGPGARLRGVRRGQVYLCNMPQVPISGRNTSSRDKDPHDRDTFRINCRAAPEGETARTGGCNTAAGVHSTTPLTVAVPPNSPASHPSLTPSPPSLPLLGELLHNVTLQNRTIEFDGGCRLWLGLGHL